MTMQKLSEVHLAVMSRLFPDVRERDKRARVSYRRLDFWSRPSWAWLNIS